jgi:hypothetical protein
MKRNLSNPSQSIEKHAKIQNDNETSLILSLPIEILFMIISYCKYESTLFLVCKSFETIMKDIWRIKCPLWDYSFVPRSPSLIISHAPHLGILTCQESKYLLCLFKMIRKSGSHCVSFSFPSRNNIIIDGIDDDNSFSFRTDVNLRCSNFDSSNKDSNMFNLSTFEWPNQCGNFFIGQEKQKVRISSASSSVETGDKPKSSMLIIPTLFRDGTLLVTIGIGKLYQLFSFWNETRLSITIGVDYVIFDLGESVKFKTCRNEKYREPITCCFSTESINIVIRYLYKVGCSGLKIGMIKEYVVLHCQTKFGISTFVISAYL